MCGCPYHRIFQQRYLAFLERLGYTVRVETGGDAEVLGVFEAGIPTRSFTRKPVGTSVLSFSRQVVTNFCCR